MPTTAVLINSENYRNSLSFFKGPSAGKTRRFDIDTKKKRHAWIVHNVADVCLVRRVSKCSVVIAAFNSNDGRDVFCSLNPGLTKFIQENRLFLVFGSNAEEQAEVIAGMIDTVKFDGWQPILNDENLKYDSKYIKDFYKRLAENLNIKNLNNSTNLTMIKYFVRNALINAPLISNQPSVSDLKDVSRDKPVLIVATGPSLNKQIPLLVQYQHIFTIVAVDTAYPILERNGIVPDYLIGLDPTSIPSWSTNSLPAHSVFAVDVGCAPGLAWSHYKNHLFSSSFDPCQWILERLGVKVETMATGGSVATTAFNFARHFNGKPIVLIGQDLALTGGKDHADGYMFTYSPDVLNQADHTGFNVEGYYGDSVRTERQLMYYKTWYEQTINNNPEIMVINSTEGGAKIAGCLQIPFQLVCEELSKIGYVKSVHYCNNPTTLNNENLLNLINELKILIVEARQYIKLAQHGQKLIEQQDVRSLDVTFDKVDDLNAKILNYDKVVRLVVDIFSSRFMDGIRKETNQETENKSLDKALDKYLRIYQEIQNSGAKSILMLRRILKFYVYLQKKGTYNLDIVTKLMNDKSIQF